MEALKNFINDYGLTISTILLIATLIFKLFEMVFKKLGLKKAANIAAGGATLASVIRTYMQNAENMFEEGAIKLEYVMTKIEKWCIDNNEEFDEEKVKAQIEEEISLSKCVNYDASKDEVKP